jgi:hypothetical protein
MHNLAGDFNERAAGNIRERSALDHRHSAQRNHTVARYVVQKNVRHIPATVIPKSVVGDVDAADVGQCSTLYTLAVNVLDLNEETAAYSRTVS